MKIDSLKILDLQKQKGMNGNQLATACGITARSLSRIKRNESTRLINARKLAQVLGVGLEEIQKKGGDEIDYITENRPVEKAERITET